MLMQGDIRHLLQRSPQRLDQARVAHIRHIRHLQRPPETFGQHRHHTLYRGDIHTLQRPSLTPSPGKRLSLVIQIEPIQPGDINLGIDLRLRQQLLT